MTPKTTWALLVMSCLWLGISLKQWMFEYYDLSNLLFAIGFFLIGLYFAYDQWKKANDLEIIQEIQSDIQAIDKKCNDLETKVIELNEGGHE